VQHSVARRTLLIDHERSAPSSLQYAAPRQMGQIAPDNPRLMKPHQTRNSFSNRPEAEGHTIVDNFSGSKKTKQKIQNPPGTMSGESGMTAAEGGFKNCWYVEECFDTAMPSSVSAIRARRADTSSAGSREAPVCLHRTLKRPERPTQTCGKHEGSLIVSTLRAFCFFGLYDSGA
jgi:hypothetical protein